MSSKGTSKGSNSGGAGGGFRARMDHYLYSGDKKHVFAGIVIISAVFGVPWYYMTRGAKHKSHQDYLEKARNERLHSSPPSSTQQH